jgi:hypothetical protein
MTGWLPCLCYATLTIALPGAALFPGIAAAEASGIDYDCTDFQNQTDAQGFYEEMGGPLYDPHHLDTDADGTACEEWERDFAQRAGTQTGGDGIDRDCADFATQSDAQRYFELDGGSREENVDYLDLNRNGVACEEGEPG